MAQRASGGTAHVTGPPRGSRAQASKRLLPGEQEAGPGAVLVSVWFWGVHKCDLVL